MSSVRNFKDLDVWQISKNLAIEIYKISENLPRSEVYGLSSQMQRASISIPSNIAEGYRRSSVKEFAHFISIAIGSAAELETQLYICSEIYNLDLSKQIDESIKLQKMLFTLKSRLK